MENNENNVVEETVTEPVPEEPVVEQPVAEEVAPVEQPVTDTVTTSSIDEPIKEEPVVELVKPPKKSKKGLIIAIIIVLLAIGCIIGGIFFFNGKDDEKDSTKGNKKKDNQTEQKDKDKPDVEPVDGDVVLGSYKTLTSSISDYDLYFLKIENKEANLIYSPLSIKYALAMLNEGTAGDSHKQIADIVGDYVPNKYANSSNMSFANSIFINTIYKDTIKNSYTNTLKEKYNAEVILDDFKSPSNINAWIKDKTLGLIENALDDLDQDEAFVLVNALGIDMEWKNTFHPKSSDGKDWYVSYQHLRFYPDYVSNINGGYPSMAFNGIKGKAYNAVNMIAIVNNYDVVTDIGESKIRETVSAEYQKWVDKETCGPKEEQTPVSEYIEQYMKELGSSYGRVDTSTDFKVYYDDSVIAVSKELKEYEGTTLEFVAIMPKEEKLTNYVKTVTGKDVSAIVNGLKEINNENFADGKITYIHGKLPIFDYDYQLDFINDLNKMGIVDIFDSTKADLSKISSKEKLYIADATHKANISLSNDGIKAAAVTTLGGKGAMACKFDYLYEPPIEDIDITFDKPYMYLIIDKDTHEVWFTGTVYEPKEMVYPNN